MENEKLRNVRFPS